MFWPFRRKPKSPDMWTQGERVLIAQGVDPRKVRRAARLARKLDRMGLLPFNIAPSEADRRR